RLWLVATVGGRRGVFFFQAEDGIRVKLVTGVQTCALPICCAADRNQIRRPGNRGGTGWKSAMSGGPGPADQKPSWVVRRVVTRRSEERRVGKEGRGGGVTEGGERWGGTGAGTGMVEAVGWA